MKVTAGRGSQLTELVRRQLRGRTPGTYTAREIAEKLGVRADSVRRCISRLRSEGHAIPHNPFKTAPRLQRAIFKLLRDEEDGVLRASAREIAERLHAHPSGVRHAITALRARGLVATKEGAGRRPPLLLLQSYDYSALNCFTKWPRSFRRRALRLAIARSDRRERRNRCGQTLFRAPSSHTQKLASAPPHPPVSRSVLSFRIGRLSTPTRVVAYRLVRGSSGPIRAWDLDRNAGSRRRRRALTKPALRPRFISTARFDAPAARQRQGYPGGPYPDPGRRRVGSFASLALLLRRPS